MWLQDNKLEKATKAAPEESTTRFDDHDQMIFATFTLAQDAFGRLMEPRL